MQRPYIDKLIEESRSFQDLGQALADGDFPIQVHGLPASGLGFLVSYLDKEEGRPLVLITYDQARAKKLEEDLAWHMGGGVYTLPGREVFFYQQEARSQDLLNKRLLTLQAMLEGRARVVISSLEALSGYYLPPEAYAQARLDLDLGDMADLDELVQDLVGLGYKRVAQVEAPGQLALRGGILDVFGPGKRPVRLEFFDIELDSIRTFDPQTQRSLESLESVSLLPVKDLVLSQEDMAGLAQDLREDLDGLSDLDRQAQDRARDKFLPLIESLEEGAYPSSTDLLIPYLQDQARTWPLAYFSQRPLVLFDEPKKSLDLFKEEEEKLEERLKNLAQAGEVLPGQRDFQRTSSAMEEALGGEDLILSTSLLGTSTVYSPKRLANFEARTITPYRGRIKDFYKELKAYVAEGYRVLVLGGREDQVQRLKDQVLEAGLSARLLTDDLKYLEPGQVYIGSGSLHGGLEVQEDSFILLNSQEIYGQKRRKRRKKRKKTLDPASLKAGDYVIHETHGVGRYEGTDQLKVQGTTRDYLKIAYYGGDRVFIPMDQISLVHRYQATEENPPSLNRLNSPVWKKTKAKAKQSVDTMAKDLIRLYGQRAQSQGYAFSPDTPWQGEFEDSFPFEETQGQLESIEEIKEDMESSQPMDRLLCADVGYGKTEVALRAAFKAIMEGKQVAFLVPTTILAHQHYNTILERFSAFPIKLGRLSRFVSKKDQDETIQGLKEGRVDLVVGTHRLLSKDVTFKDLGLIIIDEEQRFGVRHKERLKVIKKNVDCLTLTATPIPRTLQMSMAGIRDISTIKDPPQERVPVQTYVTEYNDMMVREAVLRELERGGQVFYVYNRVQMMEEVTGQLRELIPEARISMAHGQMPEGQLEDTMLAFVQGEVDLLVCSTIIETGMDISNANTMIVRDANRLGLAQLYQLRGRIGRSHRQAYAYFTYQRDRQVSELAEKRLRAISEFTEFGSGYQIALRDLEIRGSGNILGESQSGHMAAIGYELYMKFLRQAVGELRGQEEEVQTETSLDLAIDAFIPKTYIKEEGARMEMYRKVALVQDQEDVQDLLDEFIDRFSDPPRSVTRLLELSLTRARASRLGIESLTQVKETYKVKLDTSRDLDMGLFNSLAQAYGKRLTLSRTDEPGFSVRGQADAPLKEVEGILEAMTLHKKHTQEGA